MDHSIVIDLQAAQSAVHGDRGIARYSIDLTRALLDRGALVGAITFNPNLAEPRRLPDDLAESGLMTWATARTFADQRAKGPVAYQIMSPMELELPAPLVLSRAGIERSDALVVVLYDLIPLIYADRYLSVPHLRDPYLARLQLYRDADLVLAISECSRRDGIAHLGLDPDRVVNIGGGATDQFRRVESRIDPGALVRAALPDIRGDFVLTVAGYEWRKNTERLIEAYAAMPATIRQNRQLVIACAVPPEGQIAWREHGRRYGLDDRELVITGYVDDALLVRLYQSTELFVFPSMYEGFGLPVLEAARCGAPVMTSNNSSLPEILDLADSTFDPTNCEALSDAIRTGLTSEVLRAELRGAGDRATAVHAWSAVADRVVAAYERLGATEPRRRVKARPRLAIVGPLPPVESGVALYNERVFAEVDGANIEVHFFAESANGVERGRPPIDVPCYPVDALGSHLDPHDYDTVLYTVGNGAAHVRTFDLARRVPGVVWLHDADLVGLHLEWALWRMRELRHDTDVLSVFREEILDMYQGQIDPTPLLVEPLSHHAFSNAGVGLSAGLVSRARRVVVNSEHAAQRVRGGLVLGSVAPPIHVVPHAVPDQSVLPIPTSTSHRNRPLLVALGVVHEIKQPDVLIAVAARLHVDVAFVGPCDEALAATLRAQARALGIEEHVTITGFVDVATYGQWIGDASVVVLLRNVTFGESSGAVHDAIAGRKPIVTSIASVADLPGGLVHVVRPDADAAAVARAITIALDRAHANDHGSLADDYARTWTFSRVAQEIMAIVYTDATSR